MTSYARSTDMLDQYLQDNDGDNDLEALQINLEIDDILFKCNLKRKCEIFDKIVVQRVP